MKSTMIDHMQSVAAGLMIAVFILFLGTLFAGSPLKATMATLIATLSLAWFAFEEIE
jgi:hypothetical protein